MSDPAQDDICRNVTSCDRSGHMVEDGVITSFNGTGVSVRYGSNTHAKGMRREDLEWVAP
jgi:hypothetical protein